MKERMNYTGLMDFFHNSKVSDLNFLCSDKWRESRQVHIQFHGQHVGTSHPEYTTTSQTYPNMLLTCCHCCLWIVGLLDCGIAKDPALTKHNGGKPYDALAPPGSYSRIHHCDKDGETGNSDRGKKTARVCQGKFEDISWFSLFFVCRFWLAGNFLSAEVPDVLRNKSGLLFFTYYEESKDVLDTLQTQYIAKQTFSQSCRSMPNLSLDPFNLWDHKS